MRHGPKGTPTDTNLFTLLEMTANGTKEIPARVDAVHLEHLRRCLRAGLLEATGTGTARLTAAGRAALDAYLVRFPARQAVSS